MWKKWSKKVSKLCAALSWVCRNEIPSKPRLFSIKFLGVNLILWIGDHQRITFCHNQDTHTHDFDTPLDHQN